jgi:hypothetical protein
MILNVLFPYSFLTIVWEFDYASCTFVVQHWWWIVHIWDWVCVVWILGYITRPMWWVYWEPRGRLFVERSIERASAWVEGSLERWGVVTKGRRRQDTEQGGRAKRLD